MLEKRKKEQILRPCLVPENCLHRGLFTLGTAKTDLANLTFLVLGERSNHKGMPRGGGDQISQNPSFILLASCFTAATAITTSASTAISHLKKLLFSTTNEDNDSDKDEEEQEEHLDFEDDFSETVPVEHSNAA